MGNSQAEKNKRCSMYQELPWTTHLPLPMIYYDQCSFTSVHTLPALYQTTLMQILKDTLLPSTNIPKAEYLRLHAALRVAADMYTLQRHAWRQNAHRCIQPDLFKVRSLAGMLSHGLDVRELKGQVEHSKEFCFQVNLEKWNSRIHAVKGRMSRLSAA